MSLFIQGGNHNKLIRCITDVAQKHLNSFQSFAKFSGDIAKDIAKEVK